MNCTVKRALRAIESPAYAKAAAKKGSLLPPITAEMPPAEIFKLLPLSLIALRVSKSDPHEGHDHAPPAKSKKHVKGLWTVKIEQQQDISPDLHYIFLHDGPQWKTKLYAVGALLLVFTLILYPLWPLKLRIGVWYLSMGMLGLVAAFFAMAIFRLILFVLTVFTIPPGLWLYPNLFEDVGFFDSFRPVWGWQEVSSASSILCFDIMLIILHRANLPKKQKRRQRKQQRKVRGQLRAPLTLSTTLRTVAKPSRAPAASFVSEILRLE
jgi:translocation protein SEC62